MHLPTSRKTSKIKRILTILVLVATLAALGLYVTIFVIDLFSNFNVVGVFFAVIMTLLFLVLALWVVLYARE